MARYVEPRAARHKVEIVDGGEQLRIPMRRNWAFVLFVGLWLALWTIAGIAAVTQLGLGFDGFMLIWLAFWAAGWLFGALMLATMAAGSELVRVAGGDLELASGVGPIRRTWRYRGSAIRNLRRSEMDGWMPWFVRTHPMPVFFRPRTGAVRFDYGADWVFFAGGVDGPEGEAIAAWLAKRLPHAAAVASPAEDDQAPDQASV